MKALLFLGKKKTILATRCVQSLYIVFGLEEDLSLSSRPSFGFIPRFAFALLVLTRTPTPKTCLRYMRTRCAGGTEGLLSESSLLNIF